MTFDELKNTNKNLQTVKVKGNDYVQVNERVKGFRQLFPNGRIETHIKFHEDGVILIEAVAYDENGNLLATGHASENQEWGLVNKTSYVENCETSAVGRCLGFLGIGIDTAICSAEEMRNSEIVEGSVSAYITELAENADPERVDAVITLKNDLKADLIKVLKAYGSKDINAIPIDKLKQAIVRQKEALDAKAKKESEVAK